MQHCDSLCYICFDFSQGSIAFPYAADCHAEKPENWTLKYDRRLFRDVRTISGGVVVVSAAVVGKEILFEAEPTDGSIFNKVNFASTILITV